MKRAAKTFHLELGSLVGAPPTLFGLPLLELDSLIAALPDAPPTVFGFPILFDPAMPEDEVRLVGPDDVVRITGIGRCDG